MTSPVIPSLTLGDPDDISISVGTFFSDDLPSASGGIQPHTYSFTCAGGQLPSGMGFAPETRIFAGTPESAFRDSCTYTVTDSAEPAQTASRAVEVQVTSASTGPLEFPADVVVEDGNNPPNSISLTTQQRARRKLAEATGGVRPHTYDLQCDLPRGLGFSPDTRILSGTPQEVYRGPDCTYRVTDSATPPAIVSQSVEFVVDPLDRGTWRFRTRSLPQSDHPVDPTESAAQVFATLPHAIDGTGADTYTLSGHSIAVDV